MRIGNRTVPRVGVDVIFTAGFNILSTLAAGIGGILIARGLGVSGRGDYATVTSWMGAGLVFGEVGQTAAVTYFASRSPEATSDVVATAGSIMRRTGLVAIAIAMIAAFQSPAGTDRWWSYALLAVVLPVSFVTAPFVFALQALQISTWNRVRAIQPLLWLVILAAILPFARLTVPLAMATVLATILIQGVVAWSLLRRRGFRRGAVSRQLRRSMLAYGFSNLGSAVPTSLARQLDVIILGRLATSYAVGLYSVAVSYSQLTFPLATAIGSVVFPHQARSASQGHGLVWRSVKWTLLVTILGTAPLLGLADWLLPAVYGHNFRGAIPVLVVLVPGMFALAVAQVCGDLLRGMGRPQAVAVSGWVSLAVLLAALFTFAPSAHQLGAAISYSAAQVTAATILLGILTASSRREKHQTHDPRPVPSQESDG